MNVVKINLYAEAHYSGVEYSEDIVISEELFKHIKNDFDEYDYEKFDEDAKEIYVGELDGKHSEVSGNCWIDHYNEEEILHEDWENLKSDGEKLYNKLDEICAKNGLSLDDDLKNVEDYLKSVDSEVTFEITTKKSNIEKIREFANSLNSR